MATPRSASRSLYFYGPKSFTALILMGFGVVALPLTFALVYGAVHVERLAAQSQATVYKAVRATQDTRSLIEQLTAMERTVRQYQVLGDDALLEVYGENHRSFQLTLGTLITSLSDAEIIDLLNTLAAAENRQYATLTHAPPRSAAAKTAIAQFIPLTAAAQTILMRSSKMIDNEVAAMNSDTDKTLKMLLWLALSLGPIAVALAGLFTFLLNRPIKQLEQAIRHLGDGSFDIPITVSGPRDIAYLGQQLEWLRQRLADLEEQKIKFVRHVSHELKTPLTALREGAELLADEVVGDLQGEQKEVVHILRQNSIRLQKLIEDLLHFNIAVSSQSYATLETQRLDDIITRVVHDHKLTLVSKGMRVVMDLAPLHIEGEAEKLRVIVDNLLSNAVKYSPQGGTVRLALKEAGNDVILDVYDDGPGISDGEAEKIFDVFYQGSPPADGYIKGSGLGLSIAREYVLAHHGHIEALSDSDGAHFRVTFPIKQMHHVHAA